MSLVNRGVSPKHPSSEIVGALSRIAIVLAVATVVAFVARLTMGPALF